MMNGTSILLLMGVGLALPSEAGTRYTVAIPRPVMMFSFGMYMAVA